ncbi:MAG: hypothetical protein WDM77_12245 [Steroidobacteraceae bacterium]
MINRRVFLEAAAIAALPTVAGASQRVDGSPEIVPPPGTAHAALIDERFAESRRAGANLAAGGIAVHSIPDGDVTQIWLNHVGPAWTQQPVTIVGLTARPALFCLEQFALGLGLRVIFHVEHVVHPEGRTEHRLLRGAEAASLSARDLTLAGWLWPARIAEVLAMHPGKPGDARFGPSDAALSPTLPAGAQLLNSWIIAAA